MRDQRAALGLARRMDAGETCAPRLAGDLVLQQEHGHERVDRERLGERRDDDHVELDLRGGLRLPADRLHGAVADAAETDARADRRESDSDGKTE